MSNFKFRLEKVLKVRNIREDQAQNKLIKARQEKQEVETKLTQMNNAREELYCYLREREHTSVEDAILTREFLARQKQKIKQVELELNTKKEQVNECQQSFIEKRKKRQVLEKLKEKDYKRYYRELLSKQQQELDDIGQRLCFNKE